MSKRESDHMQRIKEMPCSLCGASGPCDAHHVLEGRTPNRKSPTFTAIPLCKSCHQDNHNGIHGRRAMWNILKKSELQCLSETIEQLLYMGCR